jgi:hypothetical protein
MFENSSVLGWNRLVDNNAEFLPFSPPIRARSIQGQRRRYTDITTDVKPALPRGMIVVVSEPLKLVVKRLAGGEERIDDEEMVPAGEAWGGGRPRMKPVEAVCEGGAGLTLCVEIPVAITQTCSMT